MMINTEVKRLKVTAEIKSEINQTYKAVNTLVHAVKDEADFGIYNKRESLAYIGHAISSLQALKKLVKGSTDISVDKRTVYEKTLSEKARLQSALMEAEAATEQLSLQLKMLDNRI